MTYLPIALVANALSYHTPQHLDLEDSSVPIYFRPTPDQPWAPVTRLSLQPTKAGTALELFVHTPSAIRVLRFWSAQSDQLFQIQPSPSLSEHPLFCYLPHLPSILRSQSHTLTLHPLLDPHSLSLEESRTLIQTLEPVLTPEDILSWNIPLVSKIIPRWPSVKKVEGGSEFFLELSYSSTATPQQPPQDFSCKLIMSLQDTPVFCTSTNFADHLLANRLLKLIPLLHPEWIPVKVEYVQDDCFTLSALPSAPDSAILHLYPRFSALLLSCYNIPLHTLLNEAQVPPPSYYATHPTPVSDQSPLLWLTAISHIDSCPPKPITERLSTTLQILNDLSTDLQSRLISC